MARRPENLGLCSGAPATIVVIFRRNLFQRASLPHFAHKGQPCVGKFGRDRTERPEFARPVLQGFPDLALERA